VGGVSGAGPPYEYNQPFLDWPQTGAADGAVMEIADLIVE
jgi:hypothetical protein